MLGKAVIIRDLLRKFRKVYQTAFTREVGDHGLTMPQIMVLKQVFEEPKTIGQITKALDLSYSTISGIIDRLEREKFVERVRDEEDRRVIWIRKSPEIEKTIEKIPFFTEEYYQELLEGLTEEELDMIIRSFTLIIGKIEKKVEEKE